MSPPRPGAAPAPHDPTMMAAVGLLSALAVSAAAAPVVLASAPASSTTVEIAPGVHMPIVNLGTCCGSDPTVGVKPWIKACKGSSTACGIDTAWSYKDQAAIATALSGMDRSSYFMTTKIPPVTGTAKPSDALDKLKFDLAQLKEKAVDLVLVHHPGSDANNAALWQGLEQALAQGLTKSIGVSNFSPTQLTALMKTAKVKPAVNQCHMSIKSHDTARLTFCQQHNITYEAFDAMKGCDFSSAVIKKVAAAHSVGVAQICLKWVVQTGAVIAVGTGADATKVDQYTKEDLDIFGFKLTPAEMAVLNKIGSDAALEFEEAAAPFNCTHSFEAECDRDTLPPWNKNLTCEECVKKIDKAIHAREPTADCDKEAKIFLESGCSAGDRSKKCKGVFMEECSKERPAWTHNLTCTKCVEEVEAELLKKKGFDCSEEEKVFIENKCGTKGSCKDIGSHDKAQCGNSAACEWCPCFAGGGVCAKAGTPCPR